MTLGKSRMVVCVDDEVMGFEEYPKELSRLLVFENDDDDNDVICQDEASFSLEFFVVMAMVCVCFLCWYSATDNFLGSTGHLLGILTQKSVFS